MSAARFFGDAHQPGMDFVPEDEELIEHFLLPRVRGEPDPFPGLIIEDDRAATTQPWKLFQRHHLPQKEDEDPLPAFFYVRTAEAARSAAATAAGRGGARRGTRTTTTCCAAQASEFTTDTQPQPYYTVRDEQQGHQEHGVSNCTELLLRAERERHGHRYTGWVCSLWKKWTSTAN